MEQYPKEDHVMLNFSSISHPLLYEWDSHMDISTGVNGQAPAKN